MKRVILLALVVLGAWAATALPPAEAARPTSCAAVLCQPCPEGFRLLFKPNNCCRCVPIPPAGPHS
jgi:hypothetical protein